MEPRPPGEIWNYQQVELGFNYRMTDIQAALGMSQMQRVDDFVVRRQKIALRYNEEFSALRVVTPFQEQIPNPVSICIRFGCRKILRPFPSYSFITHF